MTMTPPDILARTKTWPAQAQTHFALFRRIVIEVATSAKVGALDESLKWGQPAYLTPETKSGATIRLGCPKAGGFAIYVHCQTSIVSDFQALFPNDFDNEGNRAIHFATAEIEHYDRDAAIWMVDFVKVNQSLPEPLASSMEQVGSNTFTIEMLEQAVPQLSDFDSHICDELSKHLSLDLIEALQFLLAPLQRFETESLDVVRKGFLLFS